MISFPLFICNIVCFLGHFFALISVPASQQQHTTGLSSPRCVQMQNKVSILVEISPEWRFELCVFWGVLGAIKLGNICFKTQIRTKSTLSRKANAKKLVLRTKYAQRRVFQHTRGTRESSSTVGKKTPGATLFTPGDL